jgi:HEPN domain-containing protein
MSAHPHRLRRIQSFIILAEEEEAAARKLLPDLPRQASFFIQQSVEKLLRAVIEAEEIKAGISHNIRELAGLLPDTNPFKAKFVAHEDVSSAATRYRYPLGAGGLAIPETPGDLSDELQSIAALRKDVITFLIERKLLTKA